MVNNVIIGKFLALIALLYKKMSWVALFVRILEHFETLGGLSFPIITLFTKFYCFFRFLAKFCYSLLNLKIDQYAKINFTPIRIKSGKLKKFYFISKIILLKFTKIEQSWRKLRINSYSSVTVKIKTLAYSTVFLIVKSKSRSWLRMSQIKFAK